MKPTEFTPSPEIFRILDRHEIATFEVRKGRLGGTLPSASLGIGTRFEDFRRYVPGDDLRYLDWNALGRLGEPFVKQFAREEAGRLTLLFDRTASMGAAPGLAHTARSAVVMLAYVGLKSGYHVEIFPLPLGTDDRENGGPGGFFGRSAIGELVQWVEGQEFGVAAPLFPAVRHALGGREIGTATFLISDLADPEAGDRVFRLLRARRAKPALIQVQAPFERGMVRLGHREIVDPETGNTLRIRVTPSVRRKYLKQLKRFHDQVRHRCRALGVRHICLEAGRGPDRGMVQSLAVGGLLK